MQRPGLAAASAEETHAKPGSGRRTSPQPSPEHGAKALPPCASHFARDAASGTPRPRTVEKVSAAGVPEAVAAAQEGAAAPWSRLRPRMVSHSELRKLFCSADAVCFDVDSTVIREEGIDELAKFCGVEDAVSEMTRRAMGGSVPFKAALTERLALIQPSREQVQRLLAEHPPHLTPGIRELVSRLQERNVQVFLISGGFRSIVEHVASKLNIPLTNVFANRLKFYFNGEYAGFDEMQPTAESGGKGKVIKLLKEKFHFKKIVMIGDGATDMEACPPADVFIGFGGNVIRQQVKDNAEWYITDFVELLGALEE
ncbi:phosphoserine phosphatase [Erinaceus europaeus]|uniref:Phosphoserine phosphatase n=1 Tax=Erinaceus europaeus TaxID=9365 RepID=A0A1S3A6H8_ERIEU|nr:phosphoserine phosphatase [Erinaceus europaeus]